MTGSGFVYAGGTSDLHRIYVNGPFQLTLRAIGGPWAPENIVPDIRAGDARMAICRTVRDRDDPARISIAIDLSAVPGLVGMSGAGKLKDELSDAQDLALQVKSLIERECPGTRISVEP